MNLCCFQHLRSLSKNVLAFCRKSFGGVVTTVFYLFIGKVWDKTIFWKVFVFLYFLSFGVSEQKHFGFFLKKLSQGLANLPFDSPKERFEEKQCFEKFRYFFIFFTHWAKTFFGLFSKKFRRVCQNCILLAHRNSCRKTIFSWIYVFLTLSDLE